MDLCVVLEGLFFFPVGVVWEIKLQYSGFSAFRFIAEPLMFLRDYSIDLKNSLPRKADFDALTLEICAMRTATHAVVVFELLFDFMW